MAQAEETPWVVETVREIVGENMSYDPVVQWHVAGYRIASNGRVYSIELNAGITGDELTGLRDALIIEEIAPCVVDTEPDAPNEANIELFVRRRADRP